MIYTRKLKDVKFQKGSVMIEGLPGIGNVGKIAIDFLIDDLKAEKVYEMLCDAFPHSVFVNEKNLVELPTVSIYYKRVGKRNFFFLTGDVQPLEEVASYKFSRHILDISQQNGITDLITLGGIGLPAIQENPKLFCTGNSKKAVKKYKTKAVNEKLYGIVGPIIGVTGLLTGLASEKKIDAFCLLAETYGHPMHLGFKGARELLNYLNNQFKMKINMKRYDRDILEAESELLKKSGEFTGVSKQKMLNKLKRITKDVNYIG